MNGTETLAAFDSRNWKYRNVEEMRNV